MPRVHTYCCILHRTLYPTTTLLRAGRTGAPILSAALAIPRIAGRGLRDLGGALPNRLLRLTGDGHLLLLDARARASRSKRRSFACS